MKTLLKFKMSNLLFVMTSLFGWKSANAQSFITTWNTENPGISNVSSITIPTDGAVYDYDVDWDNDGVFDEFGIAGDVTHDFGQSGIYTIRIQGTFPKIHFNNAGDRLKLISIDQWGDISWNSFENAFSGCENLSMEALDAPSLDNVTTLSGMFRSSGIADGDFSNWDVSKITDMSFLFSFSSHFNADLSSWDVISVQNFRGMFWGASLFNQSLNNWNVTNGKDMSFMFSQAETFNQPLDDWNVENVTNMASMFTSAAAFNGKIDSWNVENVADMSFMFFFCDAFDQNLGAWTISSVLDMTNMLSLSAMSLDSYDQTLIGWESQVPPPNIALGAGGLKYCAGKNARTSLTNALNWTIEGDMEDCPYFITTWQTNNPGVSNDQSITIPTLGVGYDYDVDWDNDGIFDEFGITGTITHDFGFPGVYTIQIRGDFPYIIFDGSGDALKLVDIANWGDIQWSNFASAFNGCANLGYSATDMPDLSNVKNLTAMFWNASGFIGDISGWDVSTITNMSGMFKGASSFNQDLSSWDVSNVTTMHRMFEDAIVFNQDIGAWTTDKLNDMTQMFDGATSFNQDISLWNTSEVTSMQNTFKNASSFDQNLGGWNIEQVTSMSGMLSNTDLSTSNYDQTLIAWESQNVKDGLTLSAQGLTYCEATLERQKLITEHNWTITGDDSDCPFIFTVKTDNTGMSPDNAFTIPTTGDGYNYDIDWNNDGTFDQFGINGGVSGIYPAPGTYTIRIRGDFPRIFFNDEGDKEKIIEINQWGSIQWESMENAFEGCNELIVTATDAPDLSAVSSLASMFQYCESLTGDFSQWDVSNITDMSSMFFQTIEFNSDLSQWDVSQVTDMSAMFALCYDFNSDIGQWDVGNVVNFATMFHFAVSFNADISLWNTANATNMAVMFHNAHSFNSDVSGWDVSNVQNLNSTFAEAIEFNQDLSNWDLSSVNDMESMFLSASKFDQDLGAWNISGVEDMKNMLDNSGMSQENYDNTLIGWAAQNVQQNVELGAEGLTYCAGANARAKLINQNGWVISGDEYGCAAFITTWKTDNPGMSPDNAITIPTVGDGYDYDVDWNNDGIYDQFGISGSVSHVFGEPGTYTIRIRGAFPRIYFKGEGDKDKIIDIDQWGDVVWDDMSSAFEGCSNLNISASDAPDLSQATSMTSIFEDCISLNVDLDHWDVSSIAAMFRAFAEANSFNGNISTWNVSNVATMQAMFSGSSAFDQDLNGWDVSNVQNMTFMFGNALGFNGNISDWDVTNLDNMDYMFYNATSFNADLGSWEVSNMTSMTNAFENAISFDQDLSSWDISAVTNMKGMLDNSGLSQENYDNTLISWAAQNVQQNVKLGAEGLMYCASKEARQDLINNHEWEIIGDQKNCAAFITTWKTDNPGMSPDNAITIPTIGEGYDYDVDWNNDGVYDQFGINGSVSHIFGQPGTYTIRIRGEFPRIFFNGEGDKEKIIDIKQWGDIEWLSMADAFWQCSNLQMTAIDAPNLTQVTSMANMFSECHSFNAEIGHWDVSNVETMYALFNEASNFNQDLSSWNVSNVMSMSFMFASATSFNQDLSAWDVSNVSEMVSMFWGANVFNGELGNWDVSNVTNMYNMFAETDAFNSDIGQWQVTKVNSFEKTFYNAKLFDQDLGTWDVSNVWTMENMFNNSALSVEHYDNILISWSAQNVHSDVKLGAEGLHFCEAFDERASLMSEMNWEITGDVFECALLPVELISLAARLNDSEMVEIEWATSSEIDNDYFLVERSSDGKSFQELAVVQGSGNTSEVAYYSTLDRAPDSGINYYRLKQVDFDGSESHSQIVHIDLKKNHTIKTFPNPTTDQLNITIHGNSSKHGSLQIYNSIGQSIYQKQISGEDNGHLNVVEVSDFKSGIYHLKISLGPNVYTSTFIKE